MELFYKPRLLCERLSEISQDRRRLLRLRRTVGANLQKGHIDSLELLELLREKPPRVIYDVGANSGTWTVLAKAIFPKAEIHAFEPLKKLKSSFCERTKTLTNVNFHQVALGSCSMKMPMKLADFIDASSLLDMTEAPKYYYNVVPNGEEIVMVERLDDYVEKRALPYPDLVKLDIQGYEVEALRGAEKCLKDCATVITEVSFGEFYRNQCMFHDVVRFLGERNFWARSFSATTRLGKRLLQTDILFERVILNSRSDSFSG